MEILDIEVNSGSYEQPPLLRTCRQTRKEASSIFCEENNFELKIIDLQFAPQPQHWFWGHDIPAEKAFLSFAGQDSWSNLKQWLKRYHGDERVDNAGTISESTEGMGLTVINAFKIVESLFDIPWSKVEGVLEAFKNGVNAVAGAHGFSD